MTSYDDRAHDECRQPRERITGYRDALQEASPQDSPFMIRR